VVISVFAREEPIFFFHGSRAVTSGAVRRVGNRMDFGVAARYEGCVGLFDLDAQGRRLLGTGMRQVHSSSP
jgi:hypothetical protein